MTQPRLIRKYVNRRLYDTTESRYVNLDDLRKLILDGEEIRVTERATGADITTPVLLQIIGEGHKDSPPLFEPGMLCEAIRVAAGNPEHQTDFLQQPLKINGFGVEFVAARRERLLA